MAEVKYVSKDKLLYFYQGLKNVFAKKSDIPTKTSDLTNDSNYVADANYNTFTSAEKEKLAGIEAGANATAAYDTEISSTSVNAVQNTVIASALNGKVDAETGKGLSTNDLTDELVATINSTAQTVEGLTATGGEANVINAITYSTNGGTKTTASISNKTADIDITVPTKVSDLNNDEGYQTNVIEGVKVNDTALTPDASKVVSITVPTKTSDLTDDVGYLTSSNIAGKEDTANKVTAIASTSTDTEYPSAKAVWGLASTKADSSTTLAGYGITNAYTKTEVDNAIDEVLGSINGIDINTDYSTVEALLATTGEVGTIYLIPNGGSGNNVNDEYIWKPSTETFEMIGTTEVDLSGYVRTATLANYVLYTDLVEITNAEIDTILAS